MMNYAMAHKAHIVLATGIYAPDIGGPASFLRAIGTRLAAETPATLVTYSSVWSSPDDAKAPFRVVRIWRKWPWGIRHLLFFARLFLVSSGASAIFSLNAVSAGVPAALVAHLRRARLVVRIVGDYAWEMAVQSGATYLMIDDFQKAPVRGRIARLRALQRWVCGTAATVIVPSHYLARLVQGWGVPAEHTVVVPNATDIRPSSKTKEEARKTIGISGNIILSAGRLVPWKGFRMLIKLMPRLLQINQFARLVIVGDGPQRAELQLVIRNLGLERKVYLVGRVSAADMATYYAAADMFVLNTGYEGFSHQLLEALICGTPIITTAVGGNRELITQGENGFLVKYNDEFNLTEAMKTVWAQEDVRRGFSERGKVVAARYSLDDSYNTIASLLRGI